VFDVEAGVDVGVANSSIPGIGLHAVAKTVIHRKAIIPIKYVFLNLVCIRESLQVQNIPHLIIIDLYPDYDDF